MFDVFAEVVHSITAGHDVVMATIVSVSGSTPLPAGAKLALCGNDRNPVGSVGGGAFESDVIEAARDLLGRTESSRVLQFELSEGGGSDGMICGGTVDVMLERLSRDDAPLLSRIFAIRERGEECFLLRVLDAGRKIVRREIVNMQEAMHRKEIASKFGFAAEKVTGEDFVRAVHAAQKDGAVTVLGTSLSETVMEFIPNVRRLIIFGGGHVGRAVSRIASMAGFVVTVVDDREEYANRARFPEAEKTSVSDFAKVFDHLHVGLAASIVIVTRGHQSDEMILEQALRTQAAYIGMIGSKKKVEACYSSLQQKGVSMDRLKRVRAPIGFDIGAESSEEIAVSIVAEMIAVKRGVLSIAKPLSERMFEFFTRSVKGRTPGTQM